MNKNRLIILSIKQLLLLLLAMVCVVSCKPDQEDEPIRQEVVSLPFSLCLQADDLVKVAGAPDRRKIGDPGQTEQFLLPRYAYLFIMKQTSEGWETWRTIEQELDADNWLKQSYTGRLMEQGDSIYRYTDKINLLMVGQKFNGRVYAIASYEPLTFNQSPATVSNLNEVLNLSFALTPDIQNNLKHIYSTPYNYVKDGAYYGSFSTITQKVATLDLLLYHVAAKVDLKWQVRDDKRINLSDPSQAVRLTSLSVKNLYNGSCLAFRPKENKLPALPESGFMITDIVTSDDVSLWWEGRYYFYTILYTIDGDDRYFPLQLTMRTNGSNGSGYQLTLNQKIDISAPFVPWIRGNLRLSEPLPDLSATKYIDTD